MRQEDRGAASPTLRSLLFVPGNKASMLEKALTTRPDALVPDLEDSVPDAEKAAARATVRELLPRLASAPALLIPRVNSLETDWLEDDLAAVVGPHIAGVSIGKIRGAEDIGTISALMADLERRAGLAIGKIKLVPWIETAEAVVHCHAICKASERIAAVAFGAEDFTHDMGVERLDDETQLAYARAAICVAARAAGVPALDTPYFKFRDEEGLRTSAVAAKRLGFKGKFAIHPAQVAVLTECFSPSREEIEAAERIVAAFEEAERRGRGSTSLDGRVIDVPVVKRARAVLRLARSEPQH
ncbi:MAG TPA: CoA ester lyase [Gammaproteobacteria bacterium]|nr:CoA ester lyase [Gammaproteobacteria bacterium]